ncbi:MAG: hypothetical protein LBF89_11805 [Bacteroidales bacterium]|jgi:hypothetical protein|nr:hypothetical protein [Bacteroidales bacterium]
MELKKGYTKEELNVFMQAAFREKKQVRRTDDGGWTTVGAKNLSPVQGTKNVSPAPGAGAQTGQKPARTEAKKKGFWKRMFGGKDKGA